MSNNVASDFSGAKIGDTIRVKRPTFFVAEDWGMTHGADVTMQSAVETSVNVVIEKLYDVSFEVTNSEMSLEIDQFSSNYLAPAMAALTQKIDKYAFGKVKQLGGLSQGGDGSAAYTPLASLSDIANLSEKLNDQQVPTVGRKMVVSSKQQTKMFAIPEFVRVDHRGGATSPVIEAQLGRFMGFDVVMSQNMPSHTNGACPDEDLTLTANATVGDTTIGLSGANDSEILLAGDTLRITYNDGIQRDHKVTNATVTAASSAFAGVTISPPIYGHDEVAVHATAKIAVSAAKAVTNVSSFDGAASTYTMSGAFVKEAFELVFIPQAEPMGPGTSSASVSYNGMSLRVLQTYDHLRKKDMISIDAMVGAACVDGRLGSVITG
jgi:hypothetical protein